MTFRFCSSINSNSIPGACKFTIFYCTFTTHIMENFPVNLRQFFTMALFLKMFTVKFSVSYGQPCSTVAYGENSP